MMLDELRDEGFRTVFEAAPAGMILCNEAGEITLVNQESQRIFGYPFKEMIGLSIESLVPERHRAGHPGYRAGFMAEGHARAMGGKGNELFALRKDGTEFPVEVGLRPLELDGSRVVLATVVDITDRKRAEAEKKELEEKLRRAQKLETIGTLAGGIAHDFNNILMPILGYAEMALATVPGSDPTHEFLEEIFHGGQRAAQLVNQILLFSRQAENERSPLRLQRIVQEALKLLRPAIPATIEIRRHLDEELEVLADAGQIHQVIMNLCTNAWQAMEAQGSGVLTLTLEKAGVDEGIARLYPALAVGDYARLSVADTGPGMDESTLERIFEPFFTTKEVGKGTGLGLSIVHGIARGHQGDVVVYSEPGEGTVFHVYLPLLGTDAWKPVVVEEVRGGDEKVLLVDDDPAVGKTLRQMLERLGYEVTLFGDSAEALEDFRRDPTYDVVVTDLTMPRLTGIDLARELRSLRPDCPIMVMTGYGDDRLMEARKGPLGIDAVLKKPILERDLASSLRRVLEGSPDLAGD